MKKTLVFVHKWLGIALALLFLMWFVSGVVLYYVPFPNLTPVERLTALPPLQPPPGCCLPVREAALRAGLQSPRLADARLGLHGDRAVWRLQAAGQGGDAAPAAASGADRLRWVALDARDGTVVPALSDAQAAEVAAAFSGRRATGTGRLERDQWTVPQGLDAHRPLVRVMLDGDDGLELYVSPGAAEVVRDTRRAERFWNWLGAVPHWIYPTVLRQFPKAWHHVVVWLSIPGTLLALTGLVLGVWQLFLNRNRWIPYRKFWMRWHHIAGLVAGVFTLTWIFSGLLSMNPFGVFPARGAPAGERAQWQGAPAGALRDPSEALRVAAQAGFVPRELDTVQAGGQAWYRLRSADRLALVRADAAGTPQLVDALPDEAMVAALNTLRAGDVAAGPPTRVRRIDRYDDLYYARHPEDPNTLHTRPLPVWRADWADGVAVHADAASARILLRSDGATRWQRLLYNGLHSFDFAPLVARPVLRDLLVVGLSMLGTALCITSCVVAWRVFVPGRPRRRRLSGGPETEK